jgi:hypothetical protein
VGYPDRYLLVPCRRTAFVSTIYKRSELIPMSFRDQCEQPHVAANGVRCIDWIFSVGFQQKHEPNIERMV